MLQIGVHTPVKSANTNGKTKTLRESIFARTILRVNRAKYAITIDSPVFDLLTPDHVIDDKSPIFPLTGECFVK